MQSAKKDVAELLTSAGIAINGNNPWDIQVHNENFYTRVLAGGSLALGESYMDSWWDCPQLDEFFSHILKSNLDSVIKKSPGMMGRILLRKVLNYQNKSRAYENVQEHYNLDTNLFSKVLDKQFLYTCGYWKDATNLDEAQENKMDLACRKLKLEPGMKILDIGCGWGYFVKFAAEKYGVHAKGITISEEHVRYAKDLCKGLNVEIQNLDYRDLNEKFDRIFCFGMIEHVGHKNYRSFMQTINRCLDSQGLFLLHTIGNPYTRTYPDPWLSKYIFPNYNIPSIAQIGKAVDGLFLMEDLHNFGPDYDKTLMAWHQNFIDNWDELKDKYDVRFYRMWKYYLLACAGGFRAKRNVLWQMVFSKRTRPGSYYSVR